jgi:hypothetical protein
MLLPNWGAIILPARISSPMLVVPAMRTANSALVSRRERLNTARITLSPDCIPKIPTVLACSSISTDDQGVCLGLRPRGVHVSFVQFSRKTKVLKIISGTRTGWIPNLSNSFESDAVGISFRRCLRSRTRDSLTDGLGNTGLRGTVRTSQYPSLFVCKHASKPLRDVPATVVAVGHELHLAHISPLPSEAKYVFQAPTQFRTFEVRSHLSV